MFEITLDKKSERNGPRTGTLFQNTSTPCLIVPTVAGNSPHLMLDTLKDLPLDCFSVDYGQIMPSIACMKKHDKPIAEFIGLQDKKIFITTSNINTLTSNTKHAQGLETPNGRKFIDPQDYMDNIRVMNPDVFIAMADTVDVGCGQKRQIRSVDTSMKWLDTCIEKKPDHSFIIGVLVGGMDERRRYQCAEEMAQRKVDGYLVHGLGTSESAEDQAKLLNILFRGLSPALPRILQARLTPHEVLDAVELGIDAIMGDYPALLTQLGYASTYWVSQDLPSFQDQPALGSDGSKLSIRDKRFARDKRPLLPGCDCFACQNYMRCYINHLLNVHEILGDVLLYTHNLHHYLQLFQTIQGQIQAGTFATYKQLFTQENLPSSL